MGYANICINIHEQDILHNPVSISVPTENLPNLKLHLGYQSKHQQ